MGVSGRRYNSCPSHVAINTECHVMLVTVRHSEGPPLRRSCPPFRSSEAIGGRKSIGRIPRVRVRVRVRVRLDQPAIQVSSRSFGVADLRNGGPSEWRPLTVMLVASFAVGLAYISCQLDRSQVLPWHSVCFALHAVLTIPRNASRFSELRLRDRNIG